LFGLSRDNQLVTLSLFLWGLGEGLFWFIKPWYIGALGADPTQIGGVLALVGLVSAATYLPGGILSDRVDRRLTMLGGFVCGAVAALVMAAARHWHSLIPGLLLYSVSGYCVPAIYSYITHAAEGEDLTRTLTTVFAAFSLGLVPSPALGGWLVEVVGMRMTYVVATGLFAAATLAASRVSRQPIPDHGQQLVGRRLIRSRTFITLSALFLLVGFVTQLGQPFAPNYLEEVTGLRVGWIGFLGSAHALGGFVFGILLGRWRAGPRWGLIAAQGLIGLSFVLLLGTGTLPLLTIAFFLRGAHSASHSLATAWMGDALGRTSLGLGYGVLNTVFGLAYMLAPYAAGWLYAAEPALPFAMAAGAVPATMVVTALVAWAHKAERKTRAATDKISESASDTPLVVSDPTIRSETRASKGHRGGS
jgi:MFS family permease